SAHLKHCTSAKASGNAKTSLVRTGRKSTRRVLASPVSFLCPHFGQAAALGFSAIGSLFFFTAMALFSDIRADAGTLCALASLLCVLLPQSTAFGHSRLDRASAWCLLALCQRLVGTIDAMAGVGQSVKPLFGNRFSAYLATAKSPEFNPAQGSGN